ncbi:nucleoside ABC transporter membrane protein [Isoptericola sp. CG 20/1183]|uniref:Nucleoside ABC transporter membrane protein n=1 Tax=Isoptericola halotolerans TaxID=300560 RepID=A0ABX5EIX3_9MICO|nr:MULTISPECIES: ABC transporter permease [Isoptericola]MCK0116901.1 ABC transporter permease [Isoptericola sp. S6320L]PRZ07724.1 nucleoside ABC transporter membrane protein [Isoptericola halotolerans]PRZ07917.1 nucleoside ABC transporter membrane protein [Isoptericola sp. CG 20/1183]
MTAPAVGSAPAQPQDAPRRVSTVSRKTTVALGVVLALYAVLLLLVPHEGSARFALSTPSDFFQIPVYVVPGMLTAWLCGAVAAVLVVVSAVATRARRRTPTWVVGLYAAALLIGFLAWAAAGSPRDLSVVGLLGGALVLSVPLVYGAMTGVIGERSGVINIAIESNLLAGAFTAAVAGSLTNSPWVGLIAAMAASALVSLVLALFSITYRVNQIIVGVVLNVLVIGLTSFFYSLVLVPNTETLNATTRFERIPIPLLDRIPVIGPVLFDQTIVVYLMYLMVPGVWFALFRTRWGLRLRAVGEHPRAADTVGIGVLRTRYRALLVAGAIGGMGGAFYTVVSINQFNREMTAGAGFIALAAMIFGKWNPIRAALAGLLFGFATNLQNVLSVVGSPVPSQFMLMLPYIVTLFAVAGLVGRSRPPAALANAYTKE